MAEDPFKNFTPLPETEDPFSKFQTGTIPVEKPTEQPAEIRETEKGGFFASEAVTDSELDTLSKKYNVNKKDLKELVGWYGGMTQELKDNNLSILDTLTEAGKASVGQIGKSVGLGLPQFLYKKTIDDPNMRRAVDDLDQLVREKQSYLLDIIDIFSPVVGVAKLGTKAAPVIGAAAGLGASKEEQELESTAIGAAIGSSIPVIAKAYKGLKGWSDKALKKAVEEAEENSAKIDEIVSEKLSNNANEINTVKKAIKESNLKSFNDFLDSTDTEEIRKILTKSQLDEVTNKGSDIFKVVAKDLQDAKFKVTETTVADMLAYNKLKNIISKVEKETGQRPSKLISETGDSRFLDRTIDNIYKTDYSLDAVREANLPAKLQRLGMLNRVALVISDNQPVAKMIDQRLGTNMAEVLNDTSKKLNLYTSSLREFLPKAYITAKLIKKQKIPADDLYEKLSQKPSAEDSDVVKYVRDFFENARQAANERGIRVEKLKAGEEGYVPKLRKRATKYIKGLEDFLDSNNIRRITDKELSEEAPQSVIKELQNITGVSIKTAADYNSLVTNFIKNPSRVRSSINSKAFATRMRGSEEIPEWALEKNVPDLMSRWVQNTFRHEALREGLQDLKRIAKVAENAGDDMYHKYINNLIADTIGARTDTLASGTKALLEKFELLAYRKAEQAQNPIAKKLYDGMSNFPEALSVLGMQVYPNYLGLNPKSAIQNLTSFYLQNVPELGFGLGTKLTMEAMVDLAKFKKQGGDLGELLFSEGILPRQWTAEMVEALKTGIQSSAGRDLARKSLDKYTNTMMYFFERSERIARGMTYFIGKRLAKNLADNPKVRSQVLNRMSSSSYRNSIKKALNENNLKEAENKIIDYLNSTNMFHYDRLNMSEYGRFMGPMFSIFSKWPTSIAGRLLQNYINENKTAATIRTGQVLIMPYLTLLGLDELTKPGKGENARYDKMIGQKGLAGWTALDSVIPASGRGGFMSTPAMQAASGFYDALTSDQENSLKRWFNNTYRSFAPGAGAMRVLMEDIPIYTTGEKPEKFQVIPEE